MKKDTLTTEKLLNFEAVAERVINLRGRLSRREYALAHNVSEESVYNLERGRLTTEKSVKRIVRMISGNDPHLEHYLLYGEKFESQTERVSVSHVAGAGGTSTKYPIKDAKAQEGETFNDAMQRFGIDPAKDSSENIIQLYFDLYPEKKKDLADLIRRGKFDKIIELFE